MFKTQWPQKSSTTTESEKKKTHFLFVFASFGEFSSRSCRKLPVLSPEVSQRWFLLFGAPPSVRHDARGRHLWFHWQWTGGLEDGMGFYGLDMLDCYCILWMGWGFPDSIPAPYSTHSQHHHSDEHFSRTDMASSFVSKKSPFRYIYIYTVYIYICICWIQAQHPKRSSCKCIIFKAQFPRANPVIHKLPSQSNKKTHHPKMRFFHRCLVRWKKWPCCPWNDKRSLPCVAWSWWRWNGGNGEKGRWYNL